MSDLPPPEPPPRPLVDAAHTPPPVRRLAGAAHRAIVSLGVAWRSYSQRGPLIEIQFDNAAGVEAGQTAIRFRNVTVGVVEDMEFTPNLARVVVKARIDKDMAQYLDADTEFWLVRPQVNAQGVTGIETVLSGVYIETYWDDPSASAPPRSPPCPALR